MGHSASADRNVSPALEAMNGFIRWLVPTVEKFPRSQKFLLGDRIQGTALDVLDRLIEATYTKARQTHLQSAKPAAARSKLGSSQQARKAGAKVGPRPARRGGVRRRGPGSCDPPEPLRSRRRRNGDFFPGLVVIKTLRPGKSSRRFFLRARVANPVPIRVARGHWPVGSISGRRGDREARLR
jgi:hypothetical protein